MALPSSGSISMAQVRTELGLSGAISLNQANVRTLAGKPSGTISMSDLYGKSSTEVASISALQYDTPGSQPIGGAFPHYHKLRVTVTFTDGSTLASATLSGHQSTRINSSTIDMGSDVAATDAVRTFVITSTSGFSATYVTTSKVTVGAFRIPKPDAIPSKAIGLSRVS